ncbi:hypothetical protein BC830DRAFT_1133898 [Chytriomyces sp. MP71]|nr:hypothetical protein BC830DRAFT_1133898 [Chytriomyces sp. MP71]
MSKRCVRLQATCATMSLLLVLTAYVYVPSSPHTPSDHLINTSSDFVQLVPSTLKNMSLSQLQMLNPDSGNNPYQVCRFQKVCTKHHQTQFFTFDRYLTLHIRTLYNCCTNASQPHCPSAFATWTGEAAFCHCFTTESRATFHTLKRGIDNLDFETHPAFQISQYLKKKKHHFAHFAFSLVQLHSILLHSRVLGLPDEFKTIIFQDGAGSGNFTSTERELWRLVSSSPAGKSLNRIIDFRFLRAKVTHTYGWNEIREYPKYCFKDVYTAVGRDIYAASKEDMDAFKEAASKHLGINDGTPTTCPPRRVAILTRKRGMGLRRIINLDQVVALLHQKGIQAIEIISPSEDDTLAAQAQLFSNLGLIISSHSSQLTNILFARTNVAVIEMGPVFKEAFRHLGRVSRAQYFVSVGHRPVCEDHKELEMLFDRLRKRKCDLEQMPQSSSVACRMSAQQHVAMSRCDYVVDLKILETQLDLAFGALEQVCQSEGGWM